MEDTIEMKMVKRMIAQAVAMVFYKPDNELANMSLAVWNKMIFTVTGELVDDNPGNRYGEYKELQERYLKALDVIGIDIGVKILGCPSCGWTPDKVWDTGGGSDGKQCMIKCCNPTCDMCAWDDNKEKVISLWNNHKNESWRGGGQ